MDTRSVILSCLYESCPDEVSMIGKALVARIVDDALVGITTPFRPARGGDNFDLHLDINVIIDAASLLVALAGLWVQIRDVRKRTEEGLTKELMETRNVELGKATKFTHVFIVHIRSDDR